MVNGELVGRLRAASQQRVEKSDEFAKLAKRIERYRDFKSRKSQSVNEEEFLADRRDLNAEKEEEKQFEQQANGKGKDEVVKRDFYFNEVLSIAIDYLKELKSRNVVKAN
jgi:carboxyl-terminal processing protease